MASSEIKQKFPVFISSTYEDLIPYREGAQRVLIRLEQTIKGMEYFGSNPNKPLDVCLNSVRECKIYVGIIGMRYGSIDSTKGKSFTQLEYEEAVRNGIPALIYIISDDCPVLSKYVDTDERAEKLAEFKSILKEKHTVSFFNSPEDFSTKFTQDMVSLLDAMGRINENQEIKRDIQKEFDEIFKKFIFRPVKYQSQEGILTFKISDQPKSCSSIKINIVKALGMTFGEAVSVPVYVLDHKNHLPLSEKFFYLYGEKSCGDWIEQVSPGTIVSAKVRLNHIVTNELERYDGGLTMSDISYFNLILLEVPV